MLIKSLAVFLCLLELSRCISGVSLQPWLKRAPYVLGDLSAKKSTALGFAPDSWDWRTKGVVGPIQDQGILNDALAITSAECVDSFQAIKTGKLTTTSAWEVHDCCTATPLASASVFSCLRNIGGLCSESAYPRSKDNCGNNTCSAVATVNSGKVVPSGDESSMMAAVYQTPVIALVDASRPSFEIYRGGIYSDPGCNATRLDHALQVVGYGTEKGQDYWICKNCWGADWGEQGYIRIARNAKNMCGIATFVTYPV